MSLYESICCFQWPCSCCWLWLWLLGVIDGCYPLLSNTLWVTSLDPHRSLPRLTEFLTNRDQPWMTTNHHWPRVTMVPQRPEPWSLVRRGSDTGRFCGDRRATGCLAAAHSSGQPVMSLRVRTNYQRWLVIRVNDVYGVMREHRLSLMISAWFIAGEWPLVDGWWPTTVLRLPSNNTKNKNHTRYVPVINNKPWWTIASSC